MEKGLDRGLEWGVCWAEAGTGVKEGVGAQRGREDFQSALRLASPALSPCWGSADTPKSDSILTLCLVLTSPPSSPDHAGWLTSTLDNATACSPVSCQNYAPHFPPVLQPAVQSPPALEG